MEQETYVPTAEDVGDNRLQEILWQRFDDSRKVLNTLLYVVGVSQATLAKMTGLTRARVGHYAKYGEPIPLHRQKQFCDILRGVVAKWESQFVYVDKEPEAHPLWPEMVPVMREMLKACKLVLAAHEADD